MYSYSSEVDSQLAQLIRDNARAPLSVLDMGCGKGGDIGKWFKCRKGIFSMNLPHHIGYILSICIDHAYMSCMNRYR
jgi:hypothetical protein